MEIVTNVDELASNHIHQYVFDMVPTDELGDFVDQVLASLGDSQHIRVIRKLYLDSLKEEIIFRVGEVESI